jgi:hypothetical protein
MSSGATGFWQRHVMGQASPDDAISICKAALEKLPHDTDPRRWAQVQCELGRALYQLGMKDFSAWSEAKQVKPDLRHSLSAQDIAHRDSEIERLRERSLGSIESGAQAFLAAKREYDRLQLRPEQYFSMRCLELGCIPLQYLLPNLPEARLSDTKAKSIDKNDIGEELSSRDRELINGDAYSFLNTPPEIKALDFCKPITRASALIG